MRFQTVCVLSLLAVTFCVTAAAQPSCSVEALAGTWAAQGQGTIFVLPSGSTTRTATPESALGLVSIGYGGDVHAELTGAAGGDFTMDGKLAVNADCTGTLSAMTSQGWELNEKILVLDRENEIWTIAVGGIGNNPAVWQCKWRRIAHVPLPMFANYQNCSVAMISGTWVSSSSNVSLQPGATVPLPTALTTISTEDSGGRLAGRWTASMGGQILTGTGVATHEVNPDCTGTARSRIALADGTVLGEQTLKIVVLDDGNEIWAMITKGFSTTPSVGIERRRRISPAIQR